jgi:predicted nucleic acid-binding Zn ribbon protein
MIQVWAAWDDAVGPEVAENARPSAFKGGLVIVEVLNSGWMHHLRFLKADIIRKVNEALGGPYVEEIKFKIGTFKEEKNEGRP